MEMVLQGIWKLLELSVIVIALALPGSTGFSISPSQHPSSVIPLAEDQAPSSYILNAPPLARGPALNSLCISPATELPQTGKTAKGLAPLLAPSGSSTAFPPKILAPQHLPKSLRASSPTLPASASVTPSEPPSSDSVPSHIYTPPAPAAMPPDALVLPPPPGLVHASVLLSPPLPLPAAALQPPQLPNYSVSPPPVELGNAPSVLPHAQRKDLHNKAPPSVAAVPGPRESPISALSPSIKQRRDGIPVAAPPIGASHSTSLTNHHPHKRSLTKPKFRIHSEIGQASLPSPTPSPSNGSHNLNHSPAKGSSPIICPSSRQSKFTPVPTLSPHRFSSIEGPHSSASSKHQYPRNKMSSPPSESSYVVPWPAPNKEGQVESPYAFYAPMPSGTVRSHPPPYLNQGSSTAVVPSGHSTFAIHSSGNRKRPLVPPIQALPTSPPPPNEDCAYLMCTDPLTNTPPGSPCGCVWPMQVGLRLSVALYTFFPLVSELAKEIAAGVFLKQTQVRIMGANAASPQAEKVVVLIDLVPLGDKFNSATPFFIYWRLWRKQVAINKYLFGDYEVLYVRYPGLPPSPPMASSDIAIIGGDPFSGQDADGSKLHPLGVDVTRQRHMHGHNGGVIPLIVFLAVVVVVLCISITWFVLLKDRNHVCQSATTWHALPLPLGRPSGPAGYSVGSGLSSTPLSFGSSLAAYTGSAKTFSANEIEKATSNFNPSRILGEGGFGRVYSGILEDGTKVAVKVLKRDDHQGGREFLAEVEMLSRLHHRNLVNLIGICKDEHIRCLVYELIPNGSVESHLHGIDKEASPLDWAARMKIALGAARGLAYLHEDSSPRVIHRDFKASNILLEHDFTPKVSDFGLARTAMEEENTHISTRVMGTFGYVAPEYAMTGHLLVKSDVYSYGVVLLELLTGRKPVDMLQPPGQENLVAWARPALTTKEGLESIIDPSLGPYLSFDSVTKVAAIASMCVQPEVSHRPFMGEVVQALKLVCSGCDEAKDEESTSCSHENLSVDFQAIASTNHCSETAAAFQNHYAVHSHVSGHDAEVGVSVSDFFSTSARLSGRECMLFRRHSSSGPIRVEKGWQFWQRVRRLSWGSASEHGTIHRF
ncbi:hypothetical protein Nepgr_005921 [Nepenthes gracilis]|uniref:Protein kinase domain-containing protein n=1 Tax=Nepenthes gracilis TaxID=150966 RepID=A0AAD3S4I6_NEPGR|nr:hypothetical protein Nepgr_005921 [Nepenthes gracilis]